MSAWDASPIEALRRDIEQKDEELQAWRLRCLQAEAEVRALKRGARHAGPSQDPLAGARSNPDDGDARRLAGRDVQRPSAARECGVQKDAAEGACDEGREEAKIPPQAPQAPQAPRSMSDAHGGGVGEGDSGNPLRQDQVDARHQVEELHEEILQLQAEMLKDKTQMDRQRRLAESQSKQVRMELTEMTQRASDLSEQVKKSKKRGSELQAARDEVATLRGDLEECEARLTSEVSAYQMLREARDAVPLEARGSHAETQIAEKQAQEVPGEQNLARVSVSQESSQQLAEGAVGSGRGGPASSPEGEHPLPEDWRGSHQQLLDAQEVLRQELREQRLATERMREELVTEHCDELDDLVRQHDLERRELYQEAAMLRERCAHAEPEGAGATQPLQELREHFQGQVASMKRELQVQLADLHERLRAQAGQSEGELEELRARLQACRSELTASQGEFFTLACLYEKERKKWY